VHNIVENMLCYLMGLAGCGSFWLPVFDVDEDSTLCGGGHMPLF
jgi:hypothetical protein